MNGAESEAPAADADGDRNALAVPLAKPQPQPQPVSLQAEPPGVIGFERLRALIQKGYTADIAGAGPGGGMLLRNPGAPTLLLMPDGTVESLSLGSRAARRPEAIGGASAIDQVMFARFLERIPPIGRTRRRWGRIVLVTMLTGFLWFLTILATVILADAG